MRSSTDIHGLEVPIYNAEGDVIRKVYCEITYSMERETSYGADADGNRGMPRIEYEILGVEVHNPKLNPLTEEEVLLVERVAEHLFWKRLPLHYY